jgi:hypothetical protein
MAHLIVERTFDKPFTDDDVKAAGERLAPCLELHAVKWIRSYVSADRLRMICEYEAPDAEAVRASNRSAGVTFDCVWNAELLVP